ncbi:ABC transporter permease [Mangrovibrevibacter kandeliae]|uniref:ABC transporter permease n=1 Tax=Mangrovibrevibacter kandeliae TaxID=2968473 RepID=UPI003558339C
MATLNPPLAAPGSGVGRSVLRRLGESSALPILAVVAVLILVWYAGAVLLNWQTEGDRLVSAGAPYTGLDHVLATWSAKRPVLPAPHQIAVELWTSIATVRPTSPRSLLFHAWVTLSSTLVGFAIGTGLGILLAVGIVHSRVLDKSLMPWIIASQTVPILAVAPMVIVVLGNLQITGLLPKAVISTYLSFFPVTVGMLKGLRSPDVMHLDLMHTYSASRAQILGKLRLPAALPFLFASMKVAIAAALVGAIVAELPTGAVAGLGARLLAGSYYGQTAMIWAALVAASVMAGLLVWIVGRAEQIVLRRTGGRA